MATEAQKKATAKYLSNSCDEIKIRVKKGQKALIQEKAEKKGLSLNSYIVSLIEKDMD